VSLDYCADQFVLKLVDPARILAVSPDAVADFSYMRDTAVGVPTVRPLAEDVMALRPDLVVRSYGGGPNAATFFERAGIPVLNVPYAQSLEGVASGLRFMAGGLGAPQEGEALIAEMQDRLAGIGQSGSNGAALYMTPLGATTGPGSLVHEVLGAAGFENFIDEPGWRPIPLEHLAYDQPDHVAAAFFESRRSDTSLWSAMRHPMARRQLTAQPSTYLDGSWTACGSWFLVEAIEALAAQSGEGAQ